MKNLYCCLWVFFLSITNSSFAQTDSLAIVYEKYIQALGGQENLDKIQSIKMYSASKVGTTSHNKITNSELTYKLRPNYIRKELLNESYGLVITCFYMDSALIWDNNSLQGQTMHTWQATQKVTGRTPKIKNSVTKPLFYNFLVQCKELNYKPIYEKIGFVEGKKCYIITLIISNTTKVHYYIDCETFLLIKEHISDSFYNQSIKRHYTNYQKVNGVLFAFTVLSEGYGGGLSVSEEYEKIETNIPADPRLFDCVPLPETIENKKD